MIAITRHSCLTARRLALYLALGWITFTFTTAASAQNRPEGPSLQKQYAESRVRPGTALARLIAENQDFGLLRSAELQDDIRIPLWLRVLFRKNHPELEFRAGDPTGGYPLVLKEIWEWMVTHQDLQPAPPPPHDPPGSEEELRTLAIGSDLRISGLQVTPRSESQIRMNPWNPARIIGGSNDIQASGRLAQFYSLDGGVTWGQTSLPLEPGESFQADPTVEWTSDGTAWATTIGVVGAFTTLRMRAYKSTDNGATWTLDGTVSGTQTATDKQMTWVDSALGSPFRNNIYAIWHNGPQVYMNRRTGAGWQTPIQVSGAETTGTGIGSDVRTNSAGEVFGFWPDTGSRKLFVVKSTNGGVSYGSPVTIATTFDSYDIGFPSFASRRALIYVTAGAYRTASQSLVFAAWTDLTGVVGCNSAANAPGSSTGSACKTRIWFSRSVNGGASWSPPVMINNAASLNDQFNPWLTVDETNGRLAIMYYDTTGDAGRKKADVYYQSSIDFGATWSAAAKVTTAQTDETVAGADLGNQYGDYNGFTGYAGTFFPSWTDRRNNAREEIWTAAITETGGTGPDPAILPWGVDQVPATPPWWQTADVWVDNDLDGTVNELGEPSRGEADNQLTARITNRGSAPASGYRVSFAFKPYTTSAAAPATAIGFVDEAGTLAPGASRTYTIDWDLTDAFLQANFDPMFWTADHFCVQITVGPSGGSLDDVNPTNNSAQNNFGNVPVNKTRGFGRAKFFLYNHLDRPATASLEANVREAEGWTVGFANLADPRQIPMQPRQWLEAEAFVTAQDDATPVTEDSPVLVDVTQSIDGAPVGGLTLALKPEKLSGGGPGALNGQSLFASVATGGNWPLGDMADLYDPSFMFALGLERALSPTLRLGLQAGYHSFDAETGLPIDNLGVVNLSLLAKLLGGAGPLHPFVLAGPGAYRVQGIWEPGLQAGLGFEAPISSSLALATGATAHYVVRGGDEEDLSWIDGWLSFIFRLP